MRESRTRWSRRLAMTVLSPLFLLNLPEAVADTRADEIVAVDLLTVREPRSEAELRLRVIRLTTRSGATGYGDYLDLGFPAENEEEILARLVDRYAEQNHRKDIFLTDPSMRAVGVGHTVIGKTADQALHPEPVTGLGKNALFHREGFGPIWRGPGKARLVIALQAALLDLTEESGPCRVRLCPSMRIDQVVDDKRRLKTPDEMRQKVTSLKEAGFTAVRLDLAGALQDEMAARGECAPYRYPQEVLGRIGSLVAASKQAAGTEMDLVVAANLNLSTDGMTYLALRCERNDVTLLENAMAIRHLVEQGEARKEFRQPLGFGGDYNVLEDFAQGIKHQAGAVLAPDAGRIGGVTMLARTADLAKEVNLKVTPVVQGGPLSLMAVARSLTAREEVLWVTSPYQDEWFKEDGVLKIPLRMEQGALVAEACEINEASFQAKRVAEVNAKSSE